MHQEHNGEWELDLAPEEFDQSVQSKSTQDEEEGSMSLDIIHSERGTGIKAAKARRICKMTPEIDEKLRFLADTFHQDWSQIVPHFPGLTQTQLKRRWENHHNPDLKRSKWTVEEDQIIIALYQQYGGAWKTISRNLHGRPADAIKNHFYSCLKRTIPEQAKVVQNDAKTNSSSGLDRKEVDDETLFSMLAISSDAGSGSSVSVTPSKPSNNSEKIRRIESLQGALSSLESMLLSTKVEIKRIEEELRGRKIN